MSDRRAAAAAGASGSAAVRRSSGIVPPGPGGAGALLEATGLEVTPPGAGRPVLRGLSFQVGAGEWVALAGENGGGKTSLLLALAGLWPVSAGSLAFGGALFGPERRGAAVGIAVVLQDPGSQLLQPTVAEELAFTARNLGASADDVAREVERWRTRLALDLDPGLDPATLSAGRQQLVLLAAALVARPRLLLADEPTAHLDAASRARVREAIAAEVGAGMAVVWATQDDQELSAADRVVPVGPVPAAEMAASPAPPPPAFPSGAGGGELTLEIAPPADDHGPRVGVDAPTVIPVAAGAATALVGPNGAGKSVVLAAAAGLLATPQVRARWSAAPRRPPIMALQYPEQQVFEDVVADELAFAAVARGRRREEALADAANLLCHLGLDPALTLSRRTWELSTGEKRLVEVVGALIAPAGLVVLDEPSAGLDPVRRERLAGLVRACAAAVPVLVASQDAGWVSMAGARPFRLGS